MYRNKFSFAFLDLQFLQRGLKHFKESRPTEFFFSPKLLKVKLDYLSCLSRYIGRRVSAPAIDLQERALPIRSSSRG
jgi:hypothetical protein